MLSRGWYPHYPSLFQQEVLRGKRNPTGGRRVVHRLFPTFFFERVSGPTTYSAFFHVLEVMNTITGSPTFFPIILFAIRQLQVIPQIFYSTSHFTMLMLLTHTYTPCVDYFPYQSNVFSNVIMCLTTSCVSDATLCVRIQSSTKTFVRSTLDYFSSSKNLRVLPAHGKTYPT